MAYLLGWSGTSAILAKATPGASNHCTINEAMRQEIFPFTTLLEKSLVCISIRGEEFSVALMGPLSPLSTSPKGKIQFNVSWVGYVTRSYFQVTIKQFKYIKISTQNETLMFSLSKYAELRFVKGN